MVLPEVRVVFVFAEDLKVSIRRRRIVYGVNLHLGYGVYGLLGPNGAGKTTLMRTLATALPIAAGRLEILGLTLGQGRRPSSFLRQRIGFAPQLPLVLRHLTVYDQVAYVAWLKDVRSSEMTARVSWALEQVNLLDRAQSRTRSLSGGMLRRLGIAMAIVADPDLLLLDEPTAGLDPEQRLAFRRMVIRLGATRCVVLSTHLIEDVVAACQTVLVLNDGRTVFEGTPSGLASRADPGRTGSRSPVEAGFAQVIGVQCT